MTADEFPTGTDAHDGLTRRQFLQAMAATSAAGAVVFTGCQPLHPISGKEFRQESRVRLAEDVASAYENWYATSCTGCGAGCGLIVRVIEGRAKKIEGNPDHPLNRGKTCARAQAVVQEEYHPDRIQGPMRRDRATNTWSPISWDDALNEVVRRMRETRGSDAVMLTTSLQGQQAVLVDRFTRAYGAQWLTLDPVDEAPLREAVRRVLGQDRLPEFDIENARYVLSFGADFLGTWLSPVHYNVEYGLFRQGNYRLGQFQPRQGRPRGYLVQVEPRMSMTAANADEWVPIRPGTEGLLALGMAQVIASENLGDPEGARAVSAASLGDFQLDRVSRDTNVPQDRIRQLARDFAARRPSLAIGGGLAGAHTNGTENLSAIMALNVLVGGVGRSGGVVLNPPPAIEGLPPTRPTRMADWAQIADRMRQRQVQLALIQGANPVYSLPSLQFRQALEQTPFVISFSSFLDETTALADLVLPSNLPLEDWGDDAPDPSPGFQVVTVQQPMMRSLFDTRSFGDVLLTVGGELGGAVRTQLPWPSFKDMLRESLRPLQEQRRGSVQAPDFERFWVSVLQRGGWWDESRAQSATGGAGGGSFPTAVRDAQYDGAPDRYPFHLVVFPHQTLGAGEGAHLPWLQGLPDPLTSVTWQTWAEVSSQTAKEMGLREGDVVTVESANGRLEVPVYINPSTPPWVVSMPMGQGHTGYGRWATRDGGQRGVNPMTLLGSLTDETTGVQAYGATRVRLGKTGRRVQLPKFEGTVPAYQVPHEEVIQITRES